MDAINLSDRKDLDVWGCPKCKTELTYFEMLGQEYLYCNKCSDYAYDVETGVNIGEMREPDDDDTPY